MNKKFLLLIAIVVIVAVAGFSYYYFYSNNRRSEYLLAIKGGDNYINIGNYELALEGFNKSLGLSYNQDTEMMSKLKIGIAYTAQDPEKGTPYSKSISLDESYSPLIRAGTINLILTTYIGYRDKDFAKRVIFAGDKWQTFLINDDFSLAIKNASEWSSSIYSTFLAEYRIALWYVNQIRDDKISNDEKLNYLSVVKDRFDKGNNNLINFLEKTDPETVGWGYVYKGNISEFLSDYDKRGGTTSQDVINSYNKAIEIFTQGKVDSLYSGYYTGVKTKEPYNKHIAKPHFQRNGAIFITVRWV